MVYHGHFENGVVVFDEAPGLSEGTEVEIRVADVHRDERQEEIQSVKDENGQTLGQRLMKHAGKAENLPPDASVNLDHYLYGLPKRQP